MGHGNPNLRWQKVYQWNIGLDLSILDGRISAAVDVYNKFTRDLLSRRDLQASTGFTSYTENIGEISNKGVETMVSAYIIRNLEKRLIWSLTGRVAYNRNRIEKLSDALKKDTEEAMKQNIEINSLLFEGDPTNAIYAVRSLGIDPSTGNELYLDRNGNITETWNVADKVFLGTYDPISKITNLSRFFVDVLDKNGQDVIERDVKENNKIFHITVFSIEKEGIAGAVIEDVTVPQVRRNRIMSQAKKVIDKNLSVVQKIAYLLGENAVETESILNSIIDSFSGNESESDKGR